jgi:hypothetical protein
MKGTRLVFALGRLSNGDGINIDTIAVNNCQWHIVSTAQKLGCAVIVKASQNGKTELLVYAVKA